MPSTKRTFHVCISLGINGYVPVEARSKQEAKSAAEKMTVALVELVTGDENCDTVELSEGDNSDYRIHEHRVTSVIDLRELDRKEARR